MTREEAILYLEHTCSDDFNLEEHQIQNRLNAIQFLLEENQELKQKYENAVADYETTMFEKEQLNSLVNSCQEEIRRLKKQLEDANEKIILLQASEPMLEWKKELEENQQKEFIEWLETMNRMYQNEYKDIDTAEHYNCVLQKYKEIIGVLDENNKQ